MGRVHGVTLDVLAVPPPYGLDGRQRCKIIKDFCSVLVDLHSQSPQMFHGDAKDTNAVVEKLMGFSMSNW